MYWFPLHWTICESSRLVLKIQKPLADRKPDAMLSGDLLYSKTPNLVGLAGEGDCLQGHLPFKQDLAPRSHADQDGNKRRPIQNVPHTRKDKGSSPGNPRHRVSAPDVGSHIFADPEAASDCRPCLRSRLTFLLKVTAIRMATKDAKAITQRMPASFGVYHQTIGERESFPQKPGPTSFWVWKTPFVPDRVVGHAATPYCQDVVTADGGASKPIRRIRPPSTPPYLAQEPG